ncbi:MAG: recombinase family protein [Candidatus Pacearchaeota archaeon]|nr:recombinase family protein [Candidatus Pacearchaeota archaeon]MDE1848552.1 recombinase family protein [Nanoarchaeota archaeon]
MEEGFCFKCGSVPKRKKFGKDLCEICYHFSPDNEREFLEYINEKIDGKILETFKRYSINSGQRQKKGMMVKASNGKIMSRTPFGYKIEGKNLVPAQNYREVEEIFEDFLNNEISLRQLAHKHHLSVNGLKKILKNFTYMGKIKFNNQVFQGSHQPIISSTLFNHVQNKLERLKIK